MNKEFDDMKLKQEFSEVPECVHAAVENACQMILQKETRKVRRMSKKGVLLVAACVTLFSGMTVFAASNVWQMRMEEMNQQEVEAYFVSIAQSGAPAFHYSRPMTEEENGLFEELTLSYEEAGGFPQGCVNILSEGEVYKGKGVSYDPTSGTFFLPQKLTEEETLQIIDFYHKADFSVQKVNEQVAEGEIELPQSEPKTEKAPVIMQEFEKLNNAVDYYQFQMASENYVQEIAAGTEYFYLGYQTEIQRMPLGSNTAECIYSFGENQKLFALDADKEDNIYVSIREYEAASDSYINRLVKLDREGNTITEYDVKSAVFGEKSSLSSEMAYKMITGEDGKLYVKARWGSTLLIYVFDENGAYLDVICDETQAVHPAGEMCFGEDGMLYTLGEEAILKVDTVNRRVAAAYDYIIPDMTAAVDLIYPMGEDSFYLVSYDGIFVTHLNKGGSERLAAPYECSPVFAEGMRSYPVSKDILVGINYTQPDILVTFFKLKDAAN